MITVYSYTLYDDGHRVGDHNEGDADDDETDCDEDRGVHLYRVLLHILSFSLPPAFPWSTVTSCTILYPLLSLSSPPPRPQNVANESLIYPWHHEGRAQQDSKLSGGPGVLKMENGTECTVCAIL